MNPIFERLSDAPKAWLQKGNEWVHPFVERIEERRRLLLERGNSLWIELQDHQEKLFDRGQRALTHFEETVLERVAELLDWAYGITGQRSDAILRSREFVEDRLAELRADEANGEVDEVTVAATPVKPVAVKPATVKPKATPTEPEQAKPEPVEAPFEGYDDLNVKKLSLRLNDCDEPTLRAAREYEAANKDRKTVMQAIERLLGE